MRYTNKKCIQLKNELLNIVGLENGYTINEIYRINQNGKEIAFYINNSGFIHFLINGRNIILKNDGNLRAL